MLLVIVGTELSGNKRIQTDVRLKARNNVDEFRLEHSGMNVSQFNSTLIRYDENSLWMKFLELRKNLHFQFHVPDSFRKGFPGDGIDERTVHVDEDDFLLCNVHNLFF